MIQQSRSSRTRSSKSRNSKSRSSKRTIFRSTISMSISRSMSMSISKITSRTTAGVSAARVWATRVRAAGAESEEQYSLSILLTAIKGASRKVLDQTDPLGDFYLISGISILSIFYTFDAVASLQPKAITQWHNKTHFQVDKIKA